MKRTTLNQIIDAVAFVGMLFLTTTGVLLRYQLPPGSGRLVGGGGAGAGAAAKPVVVLWGLSRHEWGTIHYYVAIGLMAVLAMHLVLHWKWIVCVMRGRPREASGLRFGLGIAGVAAVVLLGVAPLLVSTEQVPRCETLGDATSDAEPGAGDHEAEEAIRGNMTLSEIEEVTGVPAAYLLDALGLPADTDAGERMGRLMREHELEFQQLRRVVKEYEAD